jgi:hypothetical protein
MRKIPACITESRSARSTTASFGFINPVLIGDDDEIIAGHGRVAAVKLLDLASAPTVRLSHLDMPMIIPCAPSSIARCRICPTRRGSAGVRLFPLALKPARSLTKTRIPTLSSPAKAGRTPRGLLGARNDVPASILICSRRTCSAVSLLRVGPQFQVDTESRWQIILAISRVASTMSQHCESLSRLCRGKLG